MKLLYMKLKGFRKYKELFEIQFDNETYIIGGNAKGKTTIAYAIVWAFLGTDLRGNDKRNLINKDSNECFVELDFIGNDGEKHTLIRYKHLQYSKKNFISLDGNFIKQKDLENIYIGKTLFLSAFNPDYFKELEPSEQKNLINQYLPEISFENVFQKLDESEQNKIFIKDGDIQKFIKDTNARIKDTEQKIIRKKGENEFAEKILKEKIEIKKTFDKQEEIDLLLQEKDFLETESKQKIKSKLEEEYAQKQTEVINFQTKLDKINDEGRKKRIEYNKILSDPLAMCPCCNQPMNVDSKKIASENKRQEMFKLADEQKEYKEKISQAQIDSVILKSKIYSLGNVDNSVRIKEIDERLLVLENEKKEIYDFNKMIELKKSNIENTKKDVIKIISDLENLNEQLENYNLQIIIAKKLYCMIIQEKIKIAEQYMKNVKIQFCELIKSTGELKDCFKITNNGEEITSLSKSQKFVTMLEMSNMLNKISGLNIPLLIDDFESYPDYNFKFEDYQNQLIIIKAKRNRILKVSSSEENIKRPKTIKLKTKYNLQELKNVA